MIHTMPRYNYEAYKITPKLAAAEALNRILRGEISAVEAYKQIMEKLSDDPDRTRLGQFLDFHREQVRYWKKQIDAKGIEPDTDSGPWGFVVKAFVGTAKLFGDSSTLSAIEQGEEHGLNEYRNLLENEYVSESNKEYVKKEVIPKLEMHINSFKALKKMH